jgi:hypothetical protein
MTRKCAMANRNEYLTLLKSVAWIFLLFSSACQSRQLLTPFQSGIETASPAAVVATSSSTDLPNATTNDQPEIDLSSLPQSEDYIFYISFETNTDYKIWAINPSKQIPVFVTANFALRDWSPSNKFLLFTGGQSIYIANSDGSNARAVHSYNDYESVELFWLTDDVVLFNAYKDTISLPPDMYSLDINSGAVTQIFPESSKFIQAAFSSEEKWLLAGWPVGPLEIVDKNGETEKFFDEFSIPTNIFSPYPPVQRINRLDKYLFKADAPGDANYKLWLVSKHEPPQVLFDPGIDGIDQFTVSPDEQYVAFTYNTLQGVYVYIFSLDNLQLLYKWIYPYELGGGFFVWSPDSQSIALHYSDSDVFFGIQVMDVTTGRTRIILQEDITKILDWHFIE